MDGRTIKEEPLEPEPRISGVRMTPRDTEAEWAGDHKNFAALMEAEKIAFRNANAEYHPGSEVDPTTKGQPEWDKPEWETSRRPAEQWESQIAKDWVAPPKMKWDSIPGLPNPRMQGWDSALGMNARDSAPPPGMGGLEKTLQAIKFAEDSANPKNAILDGPLEPAGASTNHREMRNMPQETEPRVRNRPRCPFGMTSKDIDFVVRMHNKQLDSVRPLLDDYYLHEFNRKNKILDELLENPQLEAEREFWLSPQRRPLPGAAHTAANTATLEKSLGTIQSWTPKAPRKIVEVTPMRSSSLLFTVTDDRVAVRAVLECGYDIMATVDDYKRRINPLPDNHALVQAEAAKLYELFAVPSDADMDEKKKLRSEKLFAQACALPKGKRLLSKGMRIFQPAHLSLIVASVIRHLGFLCNKELFSADEWNEARPFWDDICRFMSSVNSLSFLVWILWSFYEGHAADTDGFVTAISSEHGGSVIYFLLSRLYALSHAQSTPAYEKGMHSTTKILKMALEHLETIFRKSQAVARTWEIIAMLDALAGPEGRDQLRTKIQRLLKAGIAPPPRRV